MKALWTKLKGAAGDARGGIAVTAALSMLPISMLVFAAVEFHNYSTQRTTLQNALDAAALAVARAPNGATETQLRTLYVTVLKSHLRLKPGVVTLVEAAPDPVTGQGGKPELSYVNGKVTANATLSISPIIASFFVKNNLQVSGGATVLREVSGVEVALVLDNTGSMETNNRIGIAKTAAANFVTAMSEARMNSADPTKVRIALVPFAGTVNVGATNATATWMDTGGLSPIHNEIFSNARGGAVSVNRFTLLNQMQIPWAGCVESRPMPYDVEETAPNSATPGTLFVPYFAPDEMDWVPYVDRPGLPQAAYKNRYATALNNRFSGMRSSYVSGEASAMIQPFRMPNDWLPDLEPAVQGYSSGGKTTGGYWPGYVVPNKVPDAGQDYTNFMYGLLAHMGVTDFSDIGAVVSNNAAVKISTKYTKANVDAEVNAAPSRFDRNSLDEGPNRECKTKPVTRLTSNLGTVTTAISNMTLAGNTNVPMGMMWGWHALSPNAPFADGAAYGTRGNTKVMIVMTDGENSSGSGYSGVGYPWQSRLGATASNGAVDDALDARLSVLCANVKAKGIVVYTVRVEVAGDNSLLQNCATDPGKAFDVKQASELDATFKQIARSIQKLRISA